jgi:hypothetical protein
MRDATVERLHVLLGLSPQKIQQWKEAVFSVALRLRVIRGVHAWENRKLGLKWTDGT